MVRRACSPVLALAASLLIARPAPAQKPTVAARTPVEAAAPTEDRVFALVQAGKCGQAKIAAEQAGDTNLAGQIELMCGRGPSGVSSPSSKGGGGSRRGAAQGGAASSGRRSGG